MRLHELFEVHHKYDNIDKSLGRTKFHPVKKGDTFTLYHGFRELKDAVNTAKHGLSGQSRPSRIYSYEADNNPKGLFVTLNFDVAVKFVGGYQDKAIIEFIADYDELESPVWPGGGYTVQGQMSQSFGVHGRANKVLRNKARKEREAADFSDYPEHVQQSDQKYLANLLTNTSEYQTLFVGHLNPDEIAAFWVRKDDRRDPRFDKENKWERISVEEFIKRYGELEKTRRGDEILKPNEPFVGDKWIAAMSDAFGKDVSDIIGTMWKKIISEERGKKGEAFLRYFGQYLWPKQYAGAFKWFAETYGTEMK